MLSSRRNIISAFYIPQPPTATAPAATIVINGKIYPSGQALQDKFKADMPATHYETDTMDCHVLNSNYNPTNQPAGKPASCYMTLLIMVSGTVRFSNDRNVPSQTFSDTLILIPNDISRARTGGSKDWVIQSQTFRLV